jgi:hypothetical protein
MDGMYPVNLVILSGKFLNLQMIIEEIKNIKSGKKELRQFGITIGAVLGFLGAWFLWRDATGSYPLLITAVVFFSLGFILPRLLKPLHKLWMTLAVLLGWLMTRIILILLFYLVVTPIGLLARFCGKDFLNKKFDSKVNSYWIPRKATPFERKNYERQF